ncbi:MAG: hypothetical protein K2M46_00340 [Lachnospiraceae bacterium]|nr:hypothetical protein [Lachnospiraceae bacterium]
MSKKVISFILVITLSLALSTVSYAHEPSNLYDTETIEKTEDIILEFTKEDSENGIGITVIQNINDEGNITQNIISETTENYLRRINNTCSKATGGYNDGQQEFVIIHLSARNWVGSSFALEFYGHSDEILVNITGTWYAKSVNVLEPDYFNRYMTIPFYSAHNTETVTLANVNVGNATKVKLGFTNVTFKNIFGYNGSMAPSWSTVSKP